MPYIKQERQEALGFGHLDVGFGPDDAGELNYVITQACNNYWLDGTIAGKKQNYQRLNDIIGALEGAKLEFYRRVVVPYENAKMAENGDVY